MEAAMNPAEKKACDTCRTGPSILYCRSDSTFLCGDCDAGGHVHHAQVWLCQVCERSPAAVTCKADAAALCTACDADIHSANLLARRHERVPVVPFFFDSGGLDRDQIKADCFLGFGDYMKSTDCFFSDVDPYLDLEYADSMVPVQQQQQEEMKGCDDGVAVGVLRQHVQPVVDFDSGRSNNGSSYSTYSVCSSEVGVVPDANRRLGSVQTSVMAGMDRGARVMRYREKRKNRRFEKTIRYVSRKAHAETRPRIKGRFAKRTEVEADGKLLMDGGYGVVPSF